ncbi:probable serine/threonine-protein kinase DDB_G0282963 [Musca vetustissima]|uniref:probable serine/threonine-protein kinase DDB_G0282963 n=1 Tax=Musca vetustissima TaxID=27455 RepID=UPI002AB6E03D|nr:probable serine/threonine-protein kinase DDB_G0282963 [Musca vetustissima]
MAKTRIKTTPTRMQKEAQTASAAVNSSSNRIATESLLKKRICALNNAMLKSKDAIPIQQTSIIVQPPKRTNSISSATSTISHTSDGHCSSIESPPPQPPSSSSSTTTPPTTNSNGPTMDELTENAIKTLNAGLLAKTNALALKNRKVYMITEKCDDSGGGGDGASAFGGVNCVSGNGTAGNCGTGAGKGLGQKRKMYLIMEEKQTDDVNGNGLNDKFMKSENGGGTKKLTLFADASNGQLPQKIEKILPEILSCIQAKGCTAPANGNGPAITVASSNGVLTSTVNQDAKNEKPTVINDNLNTNNNNIRLKTQVDNNERLPLTLPPKKNRTKIITTQIIPVNTSNNINNSHPIPSTLNTSNNSEQLIVLKEPHHSLVSTSVPCGNSKICYTRSDNSSATPVIVNANSLINNGIATVVTNGVAKENGNKFSATAATTTTTVTCPNPSQLHKNINLSTDFLFLMKMLPRLESIAEPHKSYVKACIEDMINQYAPPGLGD